MPKLQPDKQGLLKDCFTFNSQVPEDVSISMLLPLGQDLTQEVTPRITFTGDDEVEDQNDIGNASLDLNFQESSALSTKEDNLGSSGS